MNQIGNMLRAHGIGKGDRVAIYMPCCPIAVATMLACARIGAVHNVVFAGFSAESLASRINDCLLFFIILKVSIKRLSFFKLSAKLFSRRIKQCALESIYL